MLLESPQAAAKRISARWGKSNMSREMHHLMRWHKLVVDAELVEAARLVFAPHARRNYAVAYGSARFEVAYERLQLAGFPICTSPVKMQGTMAFLLVELHFLLRRVYAARSLAYDDFRFAVVKLVRNGSVAFIRDAHGWADVHTNDRARRHNAGHEPD